jgi:serine protease AprX
MAVLKVFGTRPDRKPVLAKATLIEDYDAFAVVEATPAVARAVAQALPTEDITAHYRIPLSGREVDPLARPTQDAVDEGPHHYIVQFIGPVKPSWLSAVKRAGATLRAPYSGFAYLVRANRATVDKMRGLEAVRWVGHLPYADRVAPGLATTGKRATRGLLPRRKVVPGELVAEVFDGAHVAGVATAARALGFKVLHADKAARTLTLALGDGSGAAELAGKVRELATAHGVRFIRERVLRRPSNDVATGLMHNARAAVQPNGFRLTGAGEVVAVCDTGLDTGEPAAIHPDFAGRVLAIKSYPITPDWADLVTNPGGNDGPADLDSGHGTHVAGSVLGDGSASANGPALIRGHAHKAKLVFQAVEQEMKWKPSAPANLRGERFLLAGIPNNLKRLFQFAYDQGARIHSNSWGGGDPGAYDDQCRQFDDFVWRRKDFCFVVAAGNDGTDRDGDGRINEMSVSSPGTAKNCVTVGASENLRPEFDAQRYGDWWPGDFPVAPFRSDPMADNASHVAAFSSRGPTADGRVKPDVVAPGTFILSTRSSRIAANNFAWAAYPPDKKAYFHMGGTSMATPLTAGALALIREFLRTRRGLAGPTAALVKAVLIAGARRLPGTRDPGAVLDSDQGYGAVDLDRSLSSVLLTEEGTGLATGQRSNRTVVVKRSGQTLRIVLAYTDFPGERLVNNLNLIVIDPSGKRHVGNQRIATADLGMDATNNVEVVEVARAKKGTWGIDVVASNVPSGPQDFAVAAVLV